MSRLFLFPMISAWLSIFSITDTFSQQRSAPLSSSLEISNIEKKIRWQNVMVEDLPGLGKYSFLNFQNAHYDISKHFFPIYLEYRLVPSGTFSAEVKISDPVFVPLSDAEKTVVSSYEERKKSFITEEITPVVTISYHKKKPYAYISFIPIRKNKLSGGYEKLVDFSLQIIPVISNESKTFVSKTYVPNSVLASGRWYKIGVTEDGIYKMDYSFLKAMGMEVDSINPQNIRVYGNGGGQLPFANSAFRYDDLQENAIFISGETDGIFNTSDYVLFHGQSQHRWKYNSADNKFHHNLNIYSDTTYYFITTDLGAGKRISMQNSSSLSPTNTVTAFDDYLFHEADAVNPIKSGRRFLGEKFDILTSYSLVFGFPNIASSSRVWVRAKVAARADNQGTTFSLTAGSASTTFTVSPVSTASIFGTYYQLSDDSADSLSFYPASSSVTVTITKTTPSPAIGWLDYVELNARRQLSMYGSQMIFRDRNSAGTGNVSQFLISNSTSSLQVWEVTNPLDVKLQQTNFTSGTVDFILPTDSLREFIAFNGQSFLTPKFLREVPNQDLHASGQSDLLIVTHPLFLKQANDLADLHRAQDSMIVSVAIVEEIYNEFSSGAQDVAAVRDFVKMFYDRAADSTQLPKYLLLFGRGSYNPKLTVNNTNYVPAYESANSNEITASYPSDDFYGMLDDNEGNWDVTPDMLDLGVGRLMVKSVNEAQIVLDKIIKYTSVPGTIETGNSCTSDVCYGLGDWINTVTFIADDEDGSQHLDQADQLATKVDNSYNTYNLDKIYFDAYQQISTPGGERYPDAKADFNRRMDKGGLLVNYTGHGGIYGWAHERFLEIYDINSWTNQCKLTFFFTATCDFAVWDDPSFTTAGELTLLNPNGGAIGLMTTTRVVYSGPNYTLNSNFYDYVFTPLPNGNMPRMGDVMMLTKRSMGTSQINHRNFSLLGDPALSLHYPKYTIATTSINGVSVNPLQPDTISALSSVSIGGEVRDKNGVLLNNFNGIIYPTVYDKAATITTLGNDNTPTSTPSPLRTFLLQKNILFKGKASVTNGKFSFSFIVPKNIAYNFGKGRVSYYAHNGYEDASGFFEDFIIGGTDTTAPWDATGPDVKLYLNDDKFVFGGTTNEDPKIYAVVSDSSGINTSSGVSIGHELTAVLDGDNTKPFILNDYYEADMNSYRNGTIRYPLKSLTEGMHTLSVKVWDVYNNSSSSYTEFIVAPQAELALKHVLNYPNPFTTKTSFYFEHNQCCTNMDVQIQIFTISGKLIKNIHQSVNLEGYRSDPIEWDGTDEFGDKIGRGVYIYRVRVKVASTGAAAEQFERLVILTPK